MKIKIDKRLHTELRKNDMLEGHTFLGGDPMKEKFWERMADITEHPPEYLQEVWSCGDDVEFIVVGPREEYGELIL